MLAPLLILVAVLLTVQVRVVSLPLRHPRASWLVYIAYLFRVHRAHARAEHERRTAPLKRFNMKSWRHKVTFNDEGGMTIRPRWFIKHKRALRRVIAIIIILIITNALGFPIVSVVGAVINSNGAGGGNYSAGASWNGGVAPTAADDAIVIAGDAITVDLATDDCLSMEVQASGILDLNGNTLQTKGVNAAGFCFDLDGTLIHNNGTIELHDDGANNALMDWVGVGNPFHVVILYRDRTVTQDTACVVEGNLTITTGTWDTSGTNYALTQQLDYTEVEGTLTLNGSTVSVFAIGGAGTLNATTATMTVAQESVTHGTWGGYALYFPVGTINHNNGTITFTSPSITTIRAGVNDFGTVIINSGGPTIDFYWRCTGTVTGDLTITSGHFTEFAGCDLIVTGDVDVTGTLDYTSAGLAVTIGSLTINAGGTYSATSGTTTITSEDAGGDAFDLQTGGTLTHNNGTLAINTATGTYLRMDGTGNLYNVTIALGHVSRNLLQGTAMTVENDLTVTSGNWTTQNLALTVTGDVDLTQTLTGGTSTISFGSLTINASGTYSATSGTTTITSETAGNFALDIDGTFSHNNGTVTITYAGATTIDIIPTSGTLYNLIINNSSNTVVWVGNSIIDNDLTITSGTLQPSTVGVTLTVVGDVNVTGILGHPAWTGAGSFGSLTINSGGTYSATSGTTTITSENAGGYCFDNDGTYIHNNGTLTVTYAGTAYFDMMGAVAGNLYNVIINDASANIRWVGDSTIDNDLTITAGMFRPSGIGDTLTVTGDVDITGTLGLATATDTNTFGSLTINSGGEYIATSGTTTITSETAGGYALVNDGTFTSNNGTLTFTTAATTLCDFAGTGNPYNVILNHASLVATITATITIDNNLTITTGELDTSTVNLTVGGTTTVAGTLTGNSSTVDLHALSISAGGTVSAPDGSGALTISYWFDNYGTFTHNDGTVTFDGATGPAINHSGDTDPVFYNLTVDKAASSWAVSAKKSITIENALTVTTGHFKLDSTSTAVTVTIGTTSAIGTITNNDALEFTGNTSNAATLAAKSSAYPAEVHGSIDWDYGGAASLVTAQDLTLLDAQTVGTNTVTLTATRVDFRAALTVTTATLVGTNCTIDASTMTVSSGVYIEGWFDPTETTRGGYNWILVGGDYTITANKTYDTWHFYKVGAATLTLDTGVTLTVTNTTVDGTNITAEADLLDTNNGTFVVKYDFDCTVVNLAGTGIDGATVTLKDQNGTQLWTTTTSSGDISDQATLYASYGANDVLYYPHTLTVSHASYNTYNASWTISQRTFMPVVLTVVTSTGSGSWYNQTVSVENYTGINDYGEHTYGSPVDVSCRIMQTETEVRGPTGTLEKATTKIFCPANTTVGVKDRLTLPDGTVQYVINVQTTVWPGGTNAIKVIFT